MRPAIEHSRGRWRRAIEHHNWLHEKVNSYPPDTSGYSLDESIDALWKAVAKHLQDSGEEFGAALEDFRKAVWATVSNPSSFATTAIPALLDMVRDLALAVLDLLDALVDAAAALIATGFKELDKAFRAELPLGFPIPYGRGSQTVWGILKMPR